MIQGEAGLRLITSSRERQLNLILNFQDLDANRLIPVYLIGETPWGSPA